MNTLQKFEKFGHSINVYGTVEKPLFKASEIGKVLQLTNVHMNVKTINNDFKLLKETLRRLRAGWPTECGKAIGLYVVCLSDIGLCFLI